MRWQAGDDLGSLDRGGDSDGGAGPGCGRAVQRRARIDGDTGRCGRPRQSRRSGRALGLGRCPEGGRRLRSWEIAIDEKQASRDLVHAATDLQVELGSDAQAPESGVPGVGDTVEHFRVLRVLGQGGMGRVLLARDTRLGRLVALKIIRPDRADPERLLALLDEARLTARLAHPHIVAIHHIGRWGPTPYLALEYVEGVTLRQRAREGPLGEREVVRIGAAMASALAAAHAQGIMHRDLKPENVMVPRDGRLRVLDFGIAAVLETQAGGPRSTRGGEIVGTPGYMAPEQWTADPATPAVDLWALGVVLYELLAGHRPFDGPRADRRALPDRVRDAGLRPPPLQLELNGLSELVFALLDRNPNLRPSAIAVHERLDALLRGPATTARGGSGPFRGLLPFEEHDAGWFFGRDAEIDALVEHVRGVSVVPVVGPSGAGKSSLVRAGLLPRLREQGNWTVLALRPGSRPLEALAARLVAQDTTGRRSLATTGGRDAARLLAEELLTSPHACNVELHAIAEARATRVLLVVDQLEEVVTHARDEAERDAFLDAVASAADPVDEQVRVILTVRDDFLGRIATRAPIRDALRDVFVLRRLDAAALREAIVQPLARAGASFDDPSLPDAMVAEVEGEPAALPLVQFACATLWERRDRAAQQLRRADYEALGGVAGALGRNAEAVLTGMTPDAVEAARRLLLQLVGPEGARRVVERDAALLAAGAGAEAVVERLTAARLVTSRRDHDGHGARIVLELAHESLSRTWPQLQRWLDESIDERAALADIEAAARLWDRRGRRADELWKGDDVRDARRRLRDAAEALTEQAAGFLAAGAEAAERARKRRAVGWAGLGAALVVVAAASLGLAARFREQERVQRGLAGSLAATNREVEAKSREIAAKSQEVERAAAEMAVAAADLGIVTVSLGFFDWDAEALQVKPAEPMESVGIEVWEVDPDYPYRAFRQRESLWVRAHPQKRAGGRLSFDLETRAGVAVLRVVRRGCGVVDVPLRRFPGYAERRDREKRKDPIEVWELPVPTCAATLAGTVEIPAGPFVDGGVGEPAMAGPLDLRAEAVTHLAAFRIDRTEVPNVVFGAFATARSVTGVATPDYPEPSALPNARAPDHPVSGLDAYGAEAFCRWFGKRLPTSAEWTKAGRGGLQLANGQPNPAPRRNLPWAATYATSQEQHRCARHGKTEPSPAEQAQEQQLGAEPASAGRKPAVGTVSVVSLLCGASPYGVLHMSGNVGEWTATGKQGVGGSGVRTIRGGDWTTPANLNIGSRPDSKSKVAQTLS